MNNVKAMGFQAINVDIRSVSANSVVYAHSIGLLFSTWAYPAHEEENLKAKFVLADFHMTDRLDHMMSSGSGGGGPIGECDPYAKACH